MMPYIQETGSNTLLEWKNAGTYADSSSNEIISDFFNGRHTFVSFDSKGNVTEVKVFSEEVETTEQILNRNISSTDILPSELLKNKTARYSELDFELDSDNVSTQQILNKITEIGNDEKVIVSCSNLSYSITAFKNSRLIFHTHLITEKFDEVYYMISAVSNSFLSDKVRIFVEADLSKFDKLYSFLSKYYHHVSHLSDSLSDVCLGLDESQIIDVNWVCLKGYIQHKVRGK